MIDQEFITGSFNVPSLQGMGQVSLSSDVTDWGLSQWAVVIIGSYLAYKVINDSKIIGSKVARSTKKGRRRLAKAASSGTSKLGTVVAVGALAAAGYVGYELYTNSQTAATQ